MRIFWACLLFLSLLKLGLVSDLFLEPIPGFHDDALYVQRAFHLLQGEAFGPYDSRLLEKLPGLSIWVASVRTLGIPYLFSINLLYILAGVYVAAGLLSIGLKKIPVLIVFALYLFHPATLDQQWLRVIREPLSISLFVIFFGSLLFLLESFRNRTVAWVHLAIFSATFAFLLVVREEDRILVAGFFFLGLLLSGQIWLSGNLKSIQAWKAVGAILIFPLLLAFSIQLGLRHYVSKHYGLPILHEMTEGEYPKLISAMRSVRSRKDNRHVMITQEALQRIGAEVPQLAPVIDLLPRPSSESYSCIQFGICDEWTNGWMVFWIRDAASKANVTPNLLAAQDFFRRARLDIEQACKLGRLDCKAKGSRLIPPFEFRWTKAYLQEWAGVLRRMVSFPTTPSASYDADRTYEAQFQMTTMSHQLKGVTEDGRHARLERLRKWIVSAYARMNFLLLGLGLIGFLAFLFVRESAPLTPLSSVVFLFLALTWIRLIGLSYVSLFMGFLENRLFFSTHVLLSLFSSVFAVGIFCELAGKRYRLGLFD